MVEPNMDLWKPNHKWTQNKIIHQSLCNDCKEGSCFGAEQTGSGAVMLVWSFLLLVVGLSIVFSLIFHFMMSFHTPLILPVLPV